MLKRVKIIKMPQGKVKIMAKSFNCTVKTIYEALRYASDSEKAQLIRKTAVDIYGGVATTKPVVK